MGTEFAIFDPGENPTKTKNLDEIRNEMASVLYESNVLGSKGPRKMRVLIPAIDKEDNICTWKPMTKED
jgi:tubby-related protein 1